VTQLSATELEQLATQIKAWGLDLGFQQLGIAPASAGDAQAGLDQWLAAGFQGEMAYMAKHGHRRSRPAELVPGTVRVIMARMDYLPPEAEPPAALLNEPDTAYIARYSLGRDYHKLLRRRLQQLADRIARQFGPFGYRVFVDSGPIMEKPLAALAGLGWQGKHTNLINRDAGSWFLLGALLTDLPLPLDEPVTNHCGTCRACLDVCPTQAIVAPYQLDARRCISYLTIENRGVIPEEFRAAMGNRIFGCDDCQLFCPWNKFAQATGEADFLPRHGLDTPALLDLFSWSETEWEERTRGSALRRPGYNGWLRNIAVALGNARPSERVRKALQGQLNHASALVREHVEWALGRQHKP
jgi:epoxyqueuosine reductase